MQNDRSYKKGHQLVTSNWVGEGRGEREGVKNENKSAPVTMWPV